MEVAIDIPDDVFQTLARMAHEKNVTFNTMVEYILMDYVLGKRDKSWQPTEEEEYQPPTQIRQPEMTAYSHDVTIGGSAASLDELKDEIYALSSESGNDLSGLLGDLVFSIKTQLEGEVE